MNKFSYTDIQKKAVKHQNEIIKDASTYLQDNSDLVISGAAGTGKTTITNKILRKICKPDDNILICTLSHQALGVAQEFMRGSGLKYTAKTNASAIHATKKVLADGRIVFLPTERYTINKKGKRIRIKPPIETADKIIFDECSQICQRTLYMIDNLRHPNSKVIYLGDIAQLPPLDSGPNEIYSKVFDKHKYELTHPFRYGGYLAECNNYIRGEILNGIYGKQYDPYCWRKFIDTGREFDIIGDHKIFDREMLNSFRKNIDMTKYIAYNRYAYQQKGKWIRNKLKPQPFDYEVGDDIITKTNYYKNNILVLQNGYKGSIKGKRLMRVALIWIRTGADWQFFKLHEKKYANEGSLQKYYAQLLNMYASDIKIEELKYWSHDIDDQKFVPTFPYNPNQLTGILENLKERDSIHPSTDYNNNWEAYNEIQDFFCDIQYAYALTSHTAQGSTYKDVFVSIRNIFAEKKTTDLQKMQSLYVAVTRASDKVYCLY